MSRIDDMCKRILVAVGAGFLGSHHVGWSWSSPGFVDSYGLADPSCSWALLS